MILKASQRGGGQNLARHLLRTDDNEHVRVHELRGFMADNLPGAFKEAEAISQGTKCRQYLFSVSFSPPENARISDADFERAIDEAERRLGLEDHPRAIVFHEKEGRLHGHAVWSRIDAASMTAKQMSFFKTKLVGLSRDLYLEHDWEMPRGVAQAGMRDPANFTLAEWQQAKRRGHDPRWLKAAVQSCWQTSDTAHSFGRALESHGFFLARGDKRGFVILDHDGEVHSLPKVLAVKTKDVKARLSVDLKLPSVEDTRKAIGARMTSALRKLVEESRARFQKHSATLADAKITMTQHHREARSAQKVSQERQWNDETKVRSERLPKGLRGLWHRLTGQYQKVKTQNEIEAKATATRQALKRTELIDSQRNERARLQAEFKALRKKQAEELLEMRRQLGRFLSISRTFGRKTDRQQDRSFEMHLGR